jgi:hypothetical protein
MNQRDEPLGNPVGCNDSIPDVWWSERGIDALIWPKPYSLPESNRPIDPEAEAQQSGVCRQERPCQPSRKETRHV